MTGSEDDPRGPCQYVTWWILLSSLVLPYRNRLGIPTCSATRALQSNTPCCLSCTVSARQLPKHPQTTFTTYVHFRSRSTHTVNMRRTHPLDHTRVARHGIHMPTGLRPLSNIQVTWHEMRVFDYIMCYVVVDLFYCLLSAEWQQCRNVHTFQASTMNPNNVYTTKSADLEHNACGYNQRCYLLIGLTCWKSNADIIFNCCKLLFYGRPM